MFLALSSSSFYNPKMSHKAYLSFSILLFSLLTSCKSGGYWQHYRLVAYNEARERGYTVFLHFHEDSNPLCKEQKATLEKLIKDPAFAKTGAYRVAWGTEKALEQFTHTTQACTLIVYNGLTEKSRISGTADERLLRAAFEAGL